MAGLVGDKFRIALVQLFVGADKSANLLNAAKSIREAVSKGAQIVVLPECFNSPYGTQYFSQYSEPILGGESTQALAAVAKETGVYVVGGSIPEKDGSKIYNTCTVFGPTGDLLTKYRKCHLFDIDVPGKITFKESDVLTPGSNLGIFDTEWCKVGIGICYDLRFPELASIYAKKGVTLLLYPGAFNTTTGPAHWELLLRGRALDNQLFVGGVCEARDTTASYVAWGHTTLVSPWGEVLVKADEKETILYQDIDLSIVESTRQSIPISMQKRNDLYKLEDLISPASSS